MPVSPATHHLEISSLSPKKKNVPSLRRKKTDHLLDLGGRASRPATSSSSSLDSGVLRPRVKEVIRAKSISARARPKCTGGGGRRPGGTLDKVDFYPAPSLMTRRLCFSFPRDNLPPAPACPRAMVFFRLREALTGFRAAREVARAGSMSLVLLGNFVGDVLGFARPGGR